MNFDTATLPLARFHTVVGVVCGALIFLFVR